MSDSRMRVLTGELRPLAAPAEGKARPIEILGYTGAVVRFPWGAEVFELSGMELGGSLPFLMEHERDKRVGFARETAVTDEGLVLRGQSVPTEAAAEFFDLADAEFPWQASIGAAVIEYVRLGEGERRVVNGRELEGPLTVFTKSRIREVSVVSVGADPDTSARALSGEFAGDGPIGEEKTMATEKKTPERDPRDELRALKDAFPGQAEFVLEQYAKGNDVTAAKAELADVLTKQLAEKCKEIADLTAKVDDLEKKLAAENGVGFTPAEASTPAIPDEQLSIEERAKRDWATKLAVRQEFISEKSYAAFLRSEAAGANRIHGRDAR